MTVVDSYNQHLQEYLYNAQAWYQAEHKTNDVCSKEFVAWLANTYNIQLIIFRFVEPPDIYIQSIPAEGEVLFKLEWK